jgi:serine/threonine protein kinase
MTPERWRQITAIFHAALARDASDRAVFIAARCGHDAALRREVEAMVAAHGNAGQFGETPLFAVGAGAVAADAGSVSAHRPMNLPAGTKLGAFEIVALLGAGGMGEVYRARDTQLGRDVALKLLPDGFTHDPERLARFRREAQVLAALNHPHIGAIHGLTEAEGQQLLVLELVDGQPLSEVIARGPMPVDEALRIATQITEALETAHEKGIVHRDLKPANIALTREGNVKVLDFGLAKVIDGGGSGVSPASPTITWATTTGAGVILGSRRRGRPSTSEPISGRSVVCCSRC